MRYLPLISGLLVLAGCAGPYRNLQQSEGDADCLQKFRPRFNAELYTTQVDVFKRHLSGLLLIKKMPDQSTRIVFSSEMGVTFFDFGFSPDGLFTVYSVISQMNRKAVINLLRKDFELLLMRDLEAAPAAVLTDQNARYFRYVRGNVYNYYITSLDCKQLLRVETASRRKVKVQLHLLPGGGGIPDSIGFSHKTFPFTIGLKKLER